MDRRPYCFHRLCHRGLTSEAGQNNCFLNVIVQSLWHLGCFRTALLAPGRPAPRGPPADRRVVDALVSIFHAFAAVRITTALRLLGTADDAHHYNQHWDSTVTCW